LSAANQANDDEPEGSSPDQALAVTSDDQSPADYGGQVATRVQQGLGFVRATLDTAAKQRRVKRLGLAIVALLLITPIITWLSYQSTHVMSTNAIIRGHVTEIGTRLNGLVTGVEVDAGDRVYAGQILATLEDRHLVAEAEEARANLDGLKQELEVERLEIAYERTQLDHQLAEATANLSAAEAESVAAAIRAENDRTSYEVRRDLFAGGGAISSEAVRESESNQRTSEALMRASQAEQIAASSARTKTRLGSNALTIRERRMGVLDAKIASAQAILSKAEVDLDGSIIRAPQDGAIVRRIVQTGGSVDVGQPIISMRLGNEVWVEAWIDEEDIADVKPGNKAVVTLHSFPDSEFIGTVDRLGLTTDFEMPDEDIPQPRFSRMRGTPVVGVRITLDEPPAELMPGLSAVVSISRSGD
jgi:membrane fusion protein (multidrug efflux system)